MIIGISARSEGERSAQNTKQKTNWQKKCQRQIEIGTIYGDKPWPLSDQKTVSLVWRGAKFLTARTYES